jgi:hypothetical protein
VQHWLINAPQILPSRIVEYDTEDITCEALEERLRLVRKKAICLTEGHKASQLDGSVTQDPPDAALGCSSTGVTSEVCTKPIRQDQELAAKRLVDRDRRIRKESIAAHGKRETSKHPESVTPKKRARKRESSDSDTDAHWTTPKRYVRPSLKISPRNGRQEMVVLIPPSNIDKSLYLPYVSTSPEEQMVAEPNLDASLCSSDQQSSGRLPASEACRRQRPKATRCRPVSGIRDELGNRSAERSVHSYGWIPSIYTDDGQFLV